MTCPLCRQRVVEVDYKDVATLRRHLTERNGIPARFKRTRNRNRVAGSGLCRKHHRQLAIAIKRARIMALLPPSLSPKDVGWERAKAKHARRGG